MAGIDEESAGWARESASPASSAAGAEMLREGSPLLAIETSCDDSCAALLTGEGKVLANVVHSQDSIHERYGGVVPEVASRAHVERLTAVVAEACRQSGVTLEEVAAVAVTVGPGLIGALLVGVQTCKPPLRSPAKIICETQCSPPSSETEANVLRLSS